jgi:hypothetical protein
MKKKNVMIRSRSISGKEKCVHFLVGNIKEKGHFENKVIDRRINIKTDF